MSPLMWTAELQKRAGTAVCVPTTQARQSCRARTPRALSVLVSSFAPRGTRRDGHRETRQAVRSSCALQSHQLVERTSPTRRKEEETCRLRLDANQLRPHSTTMSTEAGLVTQQGNRWPVPGLGRIPRACPGPLQS